MASTPQTARRLAIFRSSRLLADYQGDDIQLKTTYQWKDVCKPFPEALGKAPLSEERPGKGGRCMIPTRAQSTE